MELVGINLIDRQMLSVKIVRLVFGYRLSLNILT